MGNSGQQSGARGATGSPAGTVVRAARGAALSCKGWQQEAALRMLMNSLDPDVADWPEKLITAGILGRVATDWGAFRASAEALGALQNDETLLVFAGKPVRAFPTRESAPRVLVVDSDSAANWMHIGTQAFLPIAFEIFAAASRKYFRGSLAGKLVVTEGLDGMSAAAPLAATMNGSAFLGIDQDPERAKRRVKAGYCDVMVNDLDEALRILKNAVRKREPASVGLAAEPVRAIPELAGRGVVPDLLMLARWACEESDDRVPSGANVSEAPRALQRFGSIILSCFPDTWQNTADQGAALPRTGSAVASIPELLAPMLAEGAAPIRWVALSGEPSDIRRADRLLLETSPETENLRHWITSVQNRVRYEGLPARSCVLRPSERGKFGVAINELVARGEFKAPILIVRDHTDLTCAGSAFRNGDSLRNPSGSPPDAAEVNSLLDLAEGATWASFQRHVDGTLRFVAQAIVADGTREMSHRIERVLAR